MASHGKGKRSNDPAPPAEGEVEYLRQRVAALEALVEDNLALSQRIAALDAECAALRKTLDDLRSRGIIDDLAAEEAPSPSPAKAPPVRGDKKLARERARTIEALLDLSVLEAIERRRQRPKEASILLVGEAQYLAGRGPSLAHQEIRDVLNGIPSGVGVSLLALRPPGVVEGDADAPILRDGIETIEIAMPTAAECDHVLTGLAPDVVMNVGPLAPAIEIFRNLPAGLRHAGVLNLLHGECGTLLTGSGGQAGAGVLDRAGAALVTTEMERNILLRAGFAGDIAIYLRGVNIMQTKFTGLEGGGGIVCIMENCGPQAAAFIAEVAVELNEEGIRLVMLHDGSGEEGVGGVEVLAPRSVADLTGLLERADVVLLPPGNCGLPQALQIAMTMGKVCLLPQDPFGRQALETMPGLRYPAEAGDLARIIRELVANREVYADLADRTAAHARKHFRRTEWAKVLKGFMAARLSAEAQ